MTQNLKDLLKDLHAAAIQGVSLEEWLKQNENSLLNATNLKNVVLGGSVSCKGNYKVGDTIINKS